MLFIINFCDFLLQHKIQEWTATKRLETNWQFAKRNCYRLLRVSWALTQISCLSQAGSQRFFRLLSMTVLQTDWVQTDGERRDADTHRQVVWQEGLLIATLVVRQLVCGTRQVTLGKVKFWRKKTDLRPRDQLTCHIWFPIRDQWCVFWHGYGNMTKKILGSWVCWICWICRSLSMWPSTKSQISLLSLWVGKSNTGLLSWS